MPNEPSSSPRDGALPPYDHDAATRILDAMTDPDWEDKRMSAQSEAPESPFDHDWFVARGLSLWTLEPAVEYTLVRSRDNSDAGMSECFFADPNDAERYVRRLKAAFDVGALGEHFHPQPQRLDLMMFKVRRWPTPDA